MRVIPAIDVYGGKCISLINGSLNTKNVYDENPIEVAKAFEGAGIQYLHLVDTDGAKAKQIVNYKILEQITSKTNLKIDFSGGLNSDEDVHIAFNSGAKQIIGDSISEKNSKMFERWLSKYGGIKIILKADFNPKKIVVNSLQDEENNLDIFSHIKSYINKGVNYVTFAENVNNSILETPIFELYKHFINESNDVKLIACAGVTTINDLNILEDLGCEGVIIRNALYNGTIRLNDLETYS